MKHSPNPEAFNKVNCEFTGRFSECNPASAKCSHLYGGGGRGGEVQAYPSPKKQLSMVLDLKSYASAFESSYDGQRVLF